jgi:hypothetical protein
MTLRLVDELLIAQDFGLPCIDHSRDMDDPHRAFKIKLILLLWKGDYPGQGLVSGFSHSSMSAMQCHWCLHPSPCYMAGRALLRHVCCHLPADDPLRLSLQHGLDAANPTPYEDYPPPLPRTHDGVVADMEASQAFLDEPNENQKMNNSTQPNFPGKKTGVKEWSPLVLLAFFDIVLDICLDMMHILKNWYAKHLMKVLKGKRTPSVPHWQTDNTKDTEAVRELKAAKDKRNKERFDLAVEVHYPCIYHA